MSDYKLVDTEKLESELTGMADEVRTLADTDSKMSLEAMTDNVAQANEKVDSQSEIIAQIKTALQGKAGSGGGGDDFIGIKLSDFSGGYNTPKIADMRSLSAVDFSEAFEGTNTALFASLFQNSSVNANGGFYVSLEEVYLLDGMAFIGANMFKYCSKLHTLHGDLSEVKNIGISAFQQCSKITKFPYMPKLQAINTQAFYSCIGLTEIALPITITLIATNAFKGCTNITDIYCGFAEGTIANAPWGATNSKIHYNTQFDENGNPITE